MNKEKLKTFIIVCIKNIIVLICFTVLAIVFKKWWIVLFSILLYTTVSIGDDK